MKQVALIAENDGCYELEEMLKKFIAEILTPYDINMLQFETYNINEKIEKIKKENAKVILAFDAEIGMNSGFRIVAKELYNNKIKPLLLVTNVDSEEADIEFASNSIGEVWANEDSSLELWDLYFNNLYFSYEKMAIDTVPQVNEYTKDGINALVDFITK